MNKRRKKRLLIWGLAIAAVVAAIVIALSVAVNEIEEQSHDKLSEWVASKSDSLYHTSVAQVDIGILNSSINIRQVVVKVDSTRLKTLQAAGKLPPTLASLEIGTIMVSGISWISLLLRKRIACETLTISDPKVQIQTPTREETNNYIKDTAGKGIPSVSIDKISINNPDITYANEASADQLTFFLKGGAVNLSDWSYEKNTRKLGKILYAESGDFHFDSLVLKRAGSYYSMKTATISFASSSNGFEIKNLSFIPAISKEAYYKEIGEQDEIISLNIPLLKVNGLDWDALWQKGKFTARRVQVQHPKMDVYISRLPKPAKPKERKLPGEIIRSIPNPMMIDTIVVSDGSISYTELNNLTNMEGTIPFTHVNATILNVTNIRDSIRKAPICKLTARSQLFGSIMGMDVQLDLSDSLGAFTMKGYQTSLDGTKLNEITRPLAKLEFKSMQMKKMEIAVKCDGRAIKGNVLFLYDDLKLRVLDQKDNGALKKKTLISFIFNKAFLYPANPMDGEEVRRANFTLERNINKSFFNLLWTSLRTGALLTAGRNSDVSDFIVNKEQ